MSEGIEKRYRCPVGGCNFITHSLIGVKRHYAVRHFNYCFVCDKRFHTSEQLTHHAYFRAKQGLWQYHHAAMYYLALKHPYRSKNKERKTIYEMGKEILPDLVEI
ncbi:MAG: hypothetical protein ACTSYJ_06310 [Candidatus Thorarchaeota archaeon]